MKKMFTFFIVLPLCISLTEFLWAEEKAPPPIQQKVAAKILPQNVISLEGKIKMSGKLNITNPFDFPIFNVIVAAPQNKEIIVSPAVIHIREIPAQKSINASEETTILYPASSQTKNNFTEPLRWEITYEVAKPDSSDLQKALLKAPAPEARTYLPGIRINEILFYPADSGENEWIEFFNESTTEVAINGYQVGNSGGVIYTIPDTVPPVPSGAYLVVYFGDKNSTTDDLSFTGDNIVKIYSPLQNVFNDTGDVAILYSPSGTTAGIMRSFIAWGDCKANNQAQAFIKQAIALDLWQKSTMLIPVEQADREGPVPVLAKGGSLIINKTPAGIVVAPVPPGEITPGKLNSIPVPQLHLPHDKLETSADLFTFSWIELRGVTYQFQLARDKGFKEILIDVSQLSAPRFRPENPLPRKTTLYWRVRAFYQERPSAWSESRSLAVIYSPDVSADSLNKHVVIEETRVEKLIQAFAEDGETNNGEMILAAPFTNPLGVTALPARKDSALLCLDGCDKSHWDVSNESGAQHDHSTWYCWAAASQMLNHYRGGNILKDEIVAYVKGNIDTSLQTYPAMPHGVLPENSLPHAGDAGASRADGYKALCYALQATEAQLHIFTTRPTQADLQSFIDNDRPLRYSTGGHAMVVDGYRTDGGVFQARFLNTDNDGTIEWRAWATETFVWCAAPDANLIGRAGDSRMSTDTDADGILDFDEDERFQTKSNYADTDWDGVYDKADIASYALRGINADVDGDGDRSELDSDADNGGLTDGLEDLNHDGEYDAGAGETDPQNPADDTGVVMDLVLVIDTTSSMTDDIDAAKSAAIDIVDAIDSVTDDFRVAVVSAEDFPVLPYGNPDCGDYMYHDVLNFSSDKTEIQNAILALTLHCGEDWPESHYTTLMHVLAQDALGGWRNNVSKAVILMSDAPPHDPEPVIDGFTPHTSAEVIQAALDLDPAIIYPILIGDDPAAAACYQLLADGTGGAVFQAQDATEIVNVLIQTIETTVNAPKAEASGPYRACVGIPVAFNASLSFDRNGEITTYEWDVNNDGTYDISTTEPVTAYSYNSEYKGIVRLRVTDSSGLHSIDTALADIGDSQPPVVTILSPGIDETVLGCISVKAEVIDQCNPAQCSTMSVRKYNGDSGVPIGYEDIPMSLDGASNPGESPFETGDNIWVKVFNTNMLIPGFYSLLVKAVDNSGNTGYSESWRFGVNPWIIEECLPPSNSYKAGRTVPVKFSIHVNPLICLASPFVTNKDLVIKIYDSNRNLLQESRFGLSSTDYRIDLFWKFYITNFKTLKEPENYTVEIHMASDDFLIGSFGFKTVK